MKPINPLVLLVILTFSLTITILSAQSTISGDRPGFGVSSATIPKRYVQVESGFQWLRESYVLNPVNSNVITHLDNYTTLRYGLTNWLEVKADVNLGRENHSNFNLENHSYFSPPAVGVRARLFDTEKGGRGLLYSTVSLPFLASYGRYSKPLLDIRGIYSRSLCPTWSLDVNIGALIDLQRYSQMLYSVAVTWSAGPNLNFFGEYFGTSDMFNTYGWIDGGIIITPSSRIQLDLSFGGKIHESFDFGLTETEALFATVGFAWRFPN